jgi:hypothetical protein
MNHCQDETAMVLIVAYLVQQGYPVQRIMEGIADHSRLMSFAKHHWQLLIDQSGLNWDAFVEYAGLY